MPKLDLDAIPQTNATGYPAPFDADVQGRWYRRLAPASGLTRMGASHVTLKPGAFSCLLYTSPSPRDRSLSRMPSSA